MTITRRQVFALGAGVAAVAVFAGATTASAETLADAFILAYRHSGLLEKNRAVLRAADEGKVPQWHLDPALREAAE